MEKPENNRRSFVTRRPQSKHASFNPRFRKTRNSNNNEEYKPVGECRESVCISTNSGQSHCTIFGLYHLWKGEDIIQEINSMPDEPRAIFNATLKGNAEKLEELLSNNSQFSRFVNASDPKGRTPLHLACSMGYFKTVELLLDSFGADPNALDATTCITPLICAAVIGDERIMSALLAKNVDINHGLNIRHDCIESNGMCVLECHTALNWAVKAGNDSSVKFLLEKGASICGTLMYRETPLHEAAYLGYDGILQILLQHDNSMNSKLFDLKDQSKNTALHIAVENGHEKCMQILLSYGASPNCLNANKQTPLHLAACSADYEAMALLMEFKANPNIHDSTMKRTPLHFCVIHYDGYASIECMKILLANGAQVDIQDDLGYTALHLAASYDYSALVTLLLSYSADLTQKIKSGQTCGEVLVKNMPHALRETLDSAMYLKEKDRDVADPNCTLALNFRAIVRTEKNLPRELRSHKETEFLSSLSATGYKSILTHPLIEAFLILKWQKVRKYFWASFVLNLIMVMTYSSFLILVYSMECQLEYPNTSNGTAIHLNASSTPKAYKGKGKIDMIIIAHWIVLIIMTFIFLVKEILQMIQSPMEYAKLFENYIQLLYIFTVAVTAYPIGGFAAAKDSCLCSQLNEWSYKFAAVGILVAWSLILFRIGKMPRIGLYVQMLIKVVANFAVFMTAYASILIAFALSFNILFAKKKEFKNIWISLQSVLVMMTGEVDVKHIIPTEDEGKGDDLAFPLISNIVFTAFLVLVTIVMMNLLVGLAVSDIQGLHKGAKEARLSRLVVSISQLEAILYCHGIVTMLLPKALKERLQRKASLVSSLSSDKKYTFFFKPHDPRDTRLPQALQMEALSIVEMRERDRARTYNKSNMCDKANMKLESNELLFEKINNVERALEDIRSKMDKFLVSLNRTSMFIPHSKNKEDLNV